MKVIVTGGAGFIGSTFARHLVSKGDEYDVVVLDALTYAGRRASLDDIGSSIEFLHGDICDPEAVEAAMAGCDAVVHFAAESHVTRSELDPGIFHRTNVEGTRTLLDTAVRLDVTRFVHVSTDEVYGDAANGECFAEDAKEPGDHQATSAYAKSKSRADDLALSYCDRLALNVVRPTNNFGPFQFPEKALPRWITRVLRGEPISLWGVGEQIRDWLYAPDTASAVELVLRSAPPGLAYNIGANHTPEIKNRDLAHWVLGSLREHGARIEHQLDVREHHDFRYSVDTSRIRALGWAPTSDVWDQFDRTCTWYESSRDGWSPLVAEAEAIYQ